MRGAVPDADDRFYSKSPAVRGAFAISAALRYGITREKLLRDLKILCIMRTKNRRRSNHVLSQLR